jgi:L-threonylcarbamoyladenylate synthase
MTDQDNKIIEVDPLHPDHSIIKHAASIIHRGGVVVFPARSMYGLAADAMNPEAVDRIFQIKKRSPAKPLLVLVPPYYDISIVAVEIPEKAAMIMRKFWPGLVTIILKARESIPERLTAGTGKIGIRVPGNPVASLLAVYSGRPITGTSANISEKDSCFSIGDLPSEILEAVDLVLDAGELEGGKGSTVVDASSDCIRIIREGNINTEQLQEFIS